jgi:hypothetical protein
VRIQDLRQLAVGAGREELGSELRHALWRVTNLFRSPKAIPMRYFFSSAAIPTGRVLAVDFLIPGAAARPGQF